MNTDPILFSSFMDELNKIAAETPMQFQAAVERGRASAMEGAQERGRRSNPLAASQTVRDAQGRSVLQVKGMSNPIDLQQAYDDADARAAKRVKDLRAKQGPAARAAQDILAKTRSRRAAHAAAGAAGASTLRRLMAQRDQLLRQKADKARASFMATRASRTRWQNLLHKWKGRGTQWAVRLGLRK